MHYECLGPDHGAGQDGFEIQRDETGMVNSFFERTGQPQSSGDLNKTGQGIELLNETGLRTGR